MSKNKSRCCVLGCPSIPPHFKFPTSKVLVRKWRAVLSAYCDPKLATVSAAVCSRHFLAAEWECARGRARLKRNAVPHVTDQDEKQETESTNQTDNVPNSNNKDDHEESDAENNLNTTERQNQHTSDIENNRKSPEKDESRKETTPEKDIVDKQDSKEKETEDSGMGEKEGEVSNGIDSGQERVQEVSKDSEDVAMNSSLESRKKGKSKESTPKLPSGPRDIDKDNIEDIEDLLTYYHIKQNNIHTTEEVSQDRPGTVTTDQVEIEIEPETDPVFIEISVDKDSAPGDKNDCLMVLESVQVDVDPSALMLQEDSREEVEMETLEIEEDPPAPVNDKADPISLLTSSDEDDVIIQEPHIDTVEVSDETDEDDMPLVKLLRKRRAEKKNTQRRLEKNKPPTIANITWGLYEYYCVQCHYKTSNAADYRKHMAGHAKVIMMCQLCGYMTASSSQFAKHEKQHGEKVYKCNLCDFKAKRNISLVYHMKTHKQSKEFKCGECDFVAFSDQSILKHIRYCIEGRKFKCDKCEYATKKRSDLKRHKSRKHVDDDDNDNDEDYVPPTRV